MPKEIDKLFSSLVRKPQQYKGMELVIKYGGHAMASCEEGIDFYAAIGFLRKLGMQPIIVHGGGPQIDEVLKQMGLACQFYKGRRITPLPIMNVVEMVLAGRVNKGLITEFIKRNICVAGLSGKDAGLMIAKKYHLPVKLSLIHI